MPQIGFQRFSDNFRRFVDHFKAGANRADSGTDPSVVVIPGDFTRKFATQVPTDLALIQANAQPTAIASGTLRSAANSTLDALVATDQNTLLVLLGNGDGTFTSSPSNPVSVGQGPAAMAVADFNNDGFQDVVTANTTDSSLTLLLGDGKGGFSSRQDIPLSAPPTSIAVGDFKKDLQMDLVVAEPSANQIQVLLGNGDGTFQTNYPGTNTPIVQAMDLPNSNPQTLVVADISQDGFLDVAVANQGQNSVTVFFRDNTQIVEPGVFFRAKVTYTSLINQPISLAPFFLFEFQKIALAVLNQGNSMLTILNN